MSRLRQKTRQLRREKGNEGLTSKKMIEDSRYSPYVASRDRTIFLTEKTSLVRFSTE